MYATYVVKELAGIEPWTLRNSIMSCALYQLSYKCGFGRRVGLGVRWVWASGGFGRQVGRAVAQMIKFKAKKVTYKHTHTHTNNTFISIDCLYLATVIRNSNKSRRK